MTKRMLLRRVNQLLLILIKIPLSIIPFLLFALGLIKIMGEWRIIFTPLLGHLLQDQPSNVVNILIGCTLITLSIITFILLMRYGISTVGWITSSIISVLLLLVILVLFVTPLFDFFILYFYFAKGSCTFFLNNFSQFALNNDFREFCALGNKMFGLSGY